MRGSTSIAILLAALTATANATGTDVPLVTHPTPYPCSADGACYPKRNTWGHYRTKWRKWPGDARPDVPGRDEQAVPEELPGGVSPTEVPSKEEEDRRAPLSSTERESQQMPAGPAAEPPPAQLPPGGQGPAGPGPGGPAEPAVPGGPAGQEQAPQLPPFGAPEEGADDGQFEFDPPPGLPFGEPGEQPGGENLQPGGDDLDDGFQFPSRGPNSGLRFDSDLPPALPRGLFPQQGTGSIAQRRGTTRSAAPGGDQRPPYANRQKNGLRTDAQVTPATAESAAAHRSSRVGRAVFVAPTEVTR